MPGLCRVQKETLALPTVAPQGPQLCAPHRSHLGLPRQGGTAGCYGAGGSTGYLFLRCPPYLSPLLGSSPDGSPWPSAPPGTACRGLAQAGASPSAMCALLPPGLAPSCPRLIHP